ncbi:hypothetical protein DRQ32_12355, partial [bacterium]
MYLQIRDRLQSLPLLLASLALVATNSHALEIDSIETENLRLIYQAPAQSYLAPYIARSFENSAAFQRQLFGYTIDEKVTVILTDFSDYGNASATALPRNTITAEVSPASLSFETFSSIERLQTFMNHEMVHIVNSDQASARDNKYRRWFGGKVSPVAQHPESLFLTILTTPRLTAPRWYFEGAAVFVETWMAGGHGRAQGAYDEMVFRAMVHDKAHFYRPLGLVSEGVKKDFKEGANYYLYGTRFMSYLAYTHTPEMVVAWLKRDNDSAADYEKQFEQVFGKTLDGAWEEWITWEQEFQNKNIESIQQYPITAFEDLASPPLGSVSRAFIGPEGKTMLAAVHYPGQVAHVALLDLVDGSTRRLADIKRPMLYRATSLAYDPDRGVAYYTTDNYGYRDIMRVDLASGVVEMLLEDARIGELVINPSDKSLWGVRHLNGLATLVRMPAPYNEWNQIYTWEFGEIAYDLDINPDGTLLSLSHGGPGGNQQLQIFSIEKLMGGEVTVQSSFDFGVAVPEGFVFSPDGRYLFGSSY